MTDFRWTRAGVIRVVEETKDKVKVFLPGRKASQWISRTHLLSQPHDMILFRESKNFNQDCGCTAVVEVHGTKLDPHNVYGSLEKFVSSEDKDRKPISSPYFRKKHLEEKGFSVAPILTTRKRRKNISRESQKSTRPRETFFS